MKKGNAVVLSLVVSALFLAACSGAGAGGGNSGSEEGIRGTLSGNVTWSEDVYVSGDIEVAGTLTIEPGVTVTLADDVRIYVTGALIAEGTGDGDDDYTDGDELVVFRAENPAEGWGGFYIGEGSDTNSFAYCDISGAGSDGEYAVDFDSAGGGEAVFSRCLVHGNSGGGIDASFADSGTSVLSCRFYGNGGFPLVATEAVEFDDSNLFSAQGGSTSSSILNCVEFLGDISESTTTTFDITEVPYFLSNGLNVYGTLTISEGVTVWMGDNTTLFTGGTSTLTANGTSGARISFGPRESSDAWQHVCIGEDSNANAFSFCDFTGAGAGNLYAVSFDATGDNEAEFDNCSFDGNAYGGITTAYALSATVTNCAFGDNGDDAGGPYDLYYSSSNTTQNGNTGDHIQVFTE